MSAPVLGPFSLEAPLARGGAGIVWRATHRGTGLPCAVKVLALGASANPRIVAAFHQETQATARLDHPHIVRLLEAGTTPDPAPAAEPALVPGSPWLAMELASQGALQTHGTRSWPEVRSILVAMLQALAHAHAAGVLHRDIKPANVLIAGPEDLRPGIKLTDFGLAAATGTAAETQEGLHAGTPEYASPEQIRHQWREQGPWTDLFSLACVGWELICGRPPHHAQSSMETARLRLMGEAAVFAPRIELPSGVEFWLQALLAPEPGDRPASAAEALDALRDLDAAVGPAPSGWETDPMPPPPPLLQAAGLGLLGLRPAQLVGRTEPRRMLWERLGQVRKTGQCRGVVLSGPVGAGKTRVLGWLAHRAQELGHAQALFVHHGPVPSPGSGLRGLLSRWLRIGGLRGAALRTRVREALAELDPALEPDLPAVVSWLSDAGQEQDRERPDPAAQPRARFQLLGRLLQAAARSRPVILVLDDVQWGTEALGLANHLQAGRFGAPLGVLLVVGVRTDILASLPVAYAAVDGLCAGKNIDSVQLGPLPREQVEALAVEVLGLAPALSAEIAQRAEGNPLLAELYVQDLARSGRLAPTDDGLGLAEGSTIRLPEDAQALWTERVRQALSGLPWSASAALRVAAALGVDVLTEEWDAVCATLGIRRPAGLLAALLAHDLATPAEQGLRLRHGQLQETLETSSQDHKVFARVHQACAETLAARAWTPGSHERQAHHHVLAGDRAAATVALLLAARESLQGSRYPEALATLDQRTQLLDLLGTAVDDPARGQGEIARLRALVGLGEFDLVERQASRLVSDARLHGWMGLAAKGLRYLGMAAEKQGRLSQAEERFLEAQTTTGVELDRQEAAACLCHRGTLARMRGDLASSRALLNAASHGFDELKDLQGQADCQRELAGTEATLGDPGKAERAARKAHGLYVQTGDLAGQGVTLNTIGDIRRKTGDTAAAEKAFKQARAVLERVGAHGRIFPLINLGLVLLEQAEWTQARALLGQALAELAGGRRAIQAFVHAVLLLPCAEEGDWDAFDDHATQAEGLLARTGMTEPDIARFTTAAAGTLAAAGQSERSARAAAIAAAQRARLEPASR